MWFLAVSFLEKLVYHPFQYVNALSGHNIRVWVVRWGFTVYICSVKKPPDTHEWLGTSERMFLASGPNVSVTVLMKTNYQLGPKYDCIVKSRKWSRAFGNEKVNSRTTAYWYRSDTCDIESIHRRYIWEKFHFWHTCAPMLHCYPTDWKILQ